MKILTLDNQTYSLEKIPEYVDDKLRFAVLDNSDPTNTDYFYVPLIFLESFFMMLNLLMNSRLPFWDHQLPLLPLR